MTFPIQDQIKSTDVIEVANKFAAGKYIWKGGTGSPLTITHKGKTVILKQPEGTFCSGFTSAMAIIVAKNRGLLEDKTPRQVSQIADDTNIGGMYSKLIVDALVRANIGKEVKLEDAKPGDFVQIWRREPKTGHSAIFLEHIRANGKIIGFKYRSTQTSTNGVGDFTEYFDDTKSLAPVGIWSGYKSMLRNSTFFVRMKDPSQPETTTTTTTASTSPDTTTTTTQAPGTNTQQQAEQQSAGREERTGQDPNGQNKNQVAAPPGISNLFKNTYNPPAIKMNFPADNASQKEAAQNTGYLPFVWYNTYQISYGDITYFQLATEGVIPTLKVIFRDSINLMKDKGMPLDDTKIKIYLNPRNTKLKPILLQFKITSFKVSGAQYTITGVLDMDKLYLKEFKSYKSSTSFDALQNISREMGLGFNTNLDSTNDAMTWINTGTRNVNFINRVIETSYKSDESFLLGYIDYYYHFNYVDIEKELNRNLKEELGISSFGLEEAAGYKDKEKLASFFLTNDKSRENSNMYISSYRIVNNSTSISLMEGYFTRVKYYDELTKDLLVFDVDSITTQGDKIILKGAPQDDNFYAKNINLQYLGKIDIDNAHKNYNYSYVQNTRNLTELSKISLMVELSTPNYNIYRFQKIQVVLTNTPTPSQKGFNNRLSGEWFIVDIKFEMSRGKFAQKVQLVRRDLDLSPEELQEEADKSQTPAAQKNNNSVSNTTNPTDLKNTDVGETNTNNTQTTNTTTTQEVTTTTTTLAPTRFDLDYIISDTSQIKDNSGKSPKLVLVGTALVVEQTAIAFLTMQEAAKKDGINLYISSGFRPAFGPRLTVKSKSGKTATVTTQESLRRDKSRWVSSVRANYKTDDEFVLKAPSKGFNPLTAPPGLSNHGNGTALDLDTGSRVSFSGVLTNKGKNYIWLVKNSWKYGFVRAVGTEEWHYEYVPSVAKNGPYAKVADGTSRLYYADLGITGLKKENLG